LGARVIDAKGKHVTAGIIDEHSHIAISKGVNEGGQAISAEVSIGHVVNPKDINIYRQLSGGVTASQLLHGSANPVGGQSALIKLKWGFTAEEMLIENADPFIKFALGENVKRSNWGNGTNVLRCLFSSKRIR
jgi:imidazolonepropionase-like amidohydrolase